MQILKKHSLNLRKRYLYLTALLLSCVVAFQVSNGNEVTNFLGVLRYTVLFVSNYFIWVFLIDYINGIIHSFQEKEKRLLKRIVIATISLVLLLMFHLIVTNLIYYLYLILVTDFQLNEVWSDFKPFLLKSVLSRLLDVFIIVVLVKIGEGYVRLQKQNLKLISLENQLHLSQLEALRAQLDPHFLFNTLHTLNALIGYDDEKARSMILKVTHLMRKMLDQREKHLISFEEELDYAKSYLDIEQERFHDRLKILVDIEEETKTIEVPALILQPLIENAFKHGISLMEKKGEIRLSARVKDQKMIIVLKNSIPREDRLSVVPSTKVGLNNLKNRLSQVYGESYELSTEKEETEFVVRLIIESKEKI